MSKPNSLSLFSTFKQDAGSGLVVFVVALPLCLGIALASNAPLLSGMIAGIVGGLILSWLSGSVLSVSGPAAGLTVVVASAIATLGSFERFLGAVFLSGLIQLVFGAFQLGSLSGFFPNAVIKGMLAAIGIVIILKQIPHIFGRDSDYEGDMSFWQVTDHENTFTEILGALPQFNPYIFAVALLSLSMLVIWPRVQKLIPSLSLFPPSIVAVIVGTLFSQGMAWLSPAWIIQPEHLVQIPSGSVNALFHYTNIPGLSVFLDGPVWVTAITIALIGSIETLLCLEATDRLDPKRRTSNPNRELFGQGVCNMLCGLLGGLPVTSVIVRSSANIYAGAQSRMSCFIHGVFLLLAVTLLAPLLNKIPIACLAAVLIFVGYKLANVQTIMGVARRGIDQFIPFLVTCITIIFTDILTGVGVGMLLGLLLIALTNHFGAIVVVNESNDYLFRFSKDVSFANKIFLRRSLANVPVGANVTVDATKTMFIDNDIYDILADFRSSARHRNIEVKLRGVRGKGFGLSTRRRMRNRGSAKTHVA